MEFATEPGDPAKPNEDFIAAGPTTLVLLDGCGTPVGSPSGCIHSVAWYVGRLGLELFTRASTDHERTLTDCLADAITATAAQHADTCDLDHPGTPSATVIVARQVAEQLEYLVLADSTLAIETPDGIQVITDDREGQVGNKYRGPMDAAAAGTAEHVAAHRAYVEAMRAHRNQPGGFWVAATNPAAAAEALTGTIPLNKVQGITALSDGASRAVDRFELTDWQGALDILRQQGPEALIAQVRAAEQADPDGSRWPRGKAQDDATAAWCQSRPI
ncbi:protein phosphatase 2C domain-containing protein [Yinghuangia soli]|uniref:Protein phosphatase 2C domain-containing protein n=1 Tax=Yinghuangia soli TaxID=2908204 RepID=A0AA41TX91_9ACTN|nr:protein phosphatase 2C domain-containing protein [Yinghuangia soli]MCF2526603.1 protein phosphatase 2C domain-containing protein [Yinghuangia soli]